MTDAEIIKAIENINKDSFDKDGGRTFIGNLAKKLMKTIDEDKKDVFDLFLREIRNNDKSYLKSVALETFKEMNAIDVAPAIESIYREKSSERSEEWENSIIETLLLLRYDKPIDIYAGYANNCLINESKNRIGLLVHCFMRQDGTFFLDLINNVSLKNMKSARMLKKYIIEFLTVEYEITSDVKVKRNIDILNQLNL